LDAAQVWCAACSALLPEPEPDGLLFDCLQKKAAIATNQGITLTENQKLFKIIRDIKSWNIYFKH
jgi:hypothetical protein